jgi:hypothetical protein
VKALPSAAMLALSGFAAAQMRPIPDRFGLTAPFPGIAPARLDRTAASIGIAQRAAREHKLQGRMLWIDGTANMDAVSSDEKAAALMARVARTGFNTVVYDVKPIVGRTLYPSSVAPRLTHWRGRSIPDGFDPLAALLRHARSHGLAFYVSMNAFAEGHLYARRAESDPAQGMGAPGFGYSRPDLQSVVYVAEPVLAGPSLERPVPLARTLDFPSLEAGRGRDGQPQAGLYSRIPTGVQQPCGSAVLDAAGRVVSAHSGLPDKLPDGAALAVGLGSVGEQLARALPGDRLRVDSTPKFVPMADVQTQIPLMMNPHHPEVRARALALAREVVGKYAVDGLIYDDRLRYAGADADFSPEAQQAFQRWLGRPVRFPDDVYRATFTLRMEEGVRPGPYYDAWLAFRAKTLSDWVGEVGAAVRSERKGVQFGVYAGSTYADYPRFGSNYGSSRVAAGYPFLTDLYRAQGFASKLDLVVTGCYYRFGTVIEAMERGARPGFTVEAAALVSNRVVRDESWTYAGIMLSMFWDEPSRLERALQAAAACSQGVMVFDLSHRMELFWPIFEQAFRNPARPPTSEPRLLAEVRRQRAALDARGVPDPPFPIFDGMAGAGF